MGSTVTEQPAVGKEVMEGQYCGPAVCRKCEHSLLSLFVITQCTALGPNTERKAYNPETGKNETSYITASGAKSFFKFPIAGEINTAGQCKLYAPMTDKKQKILRTLHFR